MWYLNDYSTELLDRFYRGEDEDSINDALYENRIVNGKKRKVFSEWNAIGTKICR
jgi:hypothetical protein